MIHYLCPFFVSADVVITVLSCSSWSQIHTSRSKRVAEKPSMLKRNSVKWGLNDWFEAIGGDKSIVNIAAEHPEVVTVLNDIQKAYADASNNRRTGTDVPWVHSITVSHQAWFLLPAEFYVKDNMGRLKLIVISRLVIRWFEIEAAKSYKGTDFFLDGVSPCCCPLCALILIVQEMGMGDASGYFHSILQAPGLKFWFLPNARPRDASCDCNGVGNLWPSGYIGHLYVYF